MKAISLASGTFGNLIFAIYSRKAFVTNAMHKVTRTFIVQIQKAIGTLFLGGIEPMFASPIIGTSEATGLGCMFGGDFAITTFETIGTSAGFLIKVIGISSTSATIDAKFSLLGARTKLRIQDFNFTFSSGICRKSVFTLILNGGSTVAYGMFGLVIMTRGTKTTISVRHT